MMVHHFLRLRDLRAHYSIGLFQPARIIEHTFVNGFPCPIVQLVPAHKRGFRDMIPAEYEVYVLRLAVQPYCALLCAYGVWQITLAVFLLLCHDIHGD